MVDLTPLEPRHREGFRELVAATLTEFGFRLDPALDRDLSEPESFYDAVWVALDGDEVVGTVAMRRIGDREAELKRMYLVPRWRGHGLGRRLLEVALDWARRERIRAVRLDTSERMETAQRLYEAAGFRRAGERVEEGELDRRCERFYALDLSGELR
jgi:GNAT superfamily N-acetyltransferase